jgi:hypothetical protein
MSKLPRCASRLIRTALRDLEVIEKTPGYTIDMNHWYIVVGEHCYVCFAGAVMANSLRMGLETVFAPGSLPDDEYKLYALDAFRVGHINDGLRLLKITSKHELSDLLFVVPYHLSPKDFKKTMHEIADLLEYNDL